MKFNLTKQQEKEGKKLAKEREEEVSPVAQEVIEIIAGAGLSIGEVHARDNEKYGATAKKVLELILNRNLKISDTNFLFQLVLQPFDQIKEIVLQSLKRSFEKAEANLFGKEYEEIRIEDIDRIIKEVHH